MAQINGFAARRRGNQARHLAPGAQVAQLVEQRTENPRVGGSNPPLGTIRERHHLASCRFVKPKWIVIGYEELKRS
jgi:hypothetical protein